MSLSYPHTLSPGTSALLIISLIPQDGEEGPFLLPEPFPILRPSCHKPVFTCWQEPSLSKAKKTLCSVCLDGSGPAWPYGDCLPPGTSLSPIWPHYPEDDPTKVR